MLLSSNGPSIIALTETEATIIAIYRSPSSSSPDDLIVFEAIRHVATAPGECRIVGDFNAPPLTGQIAHFPSPMCSIKTFLPMQSKNFFTPTTRFRMGYWPSVLNLVFTKFSDTVSAIKLLAPLGPSHLDFTIHTSPYNQGLNGATINE